MGKSFLLVLYVIYFAKLGTDGFSLVRFGTKVSDSKGGCKMYVKYRTKEIV